MGDVHELFIHYFSKGDIMSIYIRKTATFTGYKNFQKILMLPKPYCERRLAEYLKQIGFKRLPSDVKTNG